MRVLENNRTTEDNYQLKFETESDPQENTQQVVEELQFDQSTIICH